MSNIKIWQRILCMETESIVSLLMKTEQVQKYALDIVQLIAIQNLAAAQL